MLLSAKHKPCKSCEGAGHTAFNCPRKPRKAMQATKPMRRGKRLKSIGRIGQALLDQRTQYFEENEPPYYCIYCLVIGIDVPILEEDAQLEHGHTKNDYPGLRFTKSNLHISCSFHNEDKGSKDIDEYIEELRRHHAARSNN